MNRRAIRIAIALALLATPAGAQNGETEAVKRLIRDYKQNPTATLESVIGMQDGDIQKYVTACRGTPPGSRSLVPSGAGPTTSIVPNGSPACSRHDFLTMAALFLDGGVTLIDQDYNRSGRFIGHGESLLEGLYRDYPEHTSIETTFISLWYSHAARFLLTQHFLQRAINLVEKVVPWFAENADIEVTRGLVAEIPYGWLVSNLRGKERTVIDENVAPFTFYRPSSAPNQGPYQVAANQYLQALKIAPNHVRALLRLAWVRVRMRDVRATDDAQRALSLAEDDDERYLASLLLAAASDVREDSAAAIDAYISARKVGPSYQSACTGLAGAYASSGDGELASRTSLECVALEEDDAHPDPWLTLRFGLTEPAIVRWLDEEARRP